MPSTTTAEQSKRGGLGRLLLSDNEVRSLREIIRFLKPQPSSHTGLEGQATQQIRESIPGSTACSQPSNQTRELHRKLETLLKDSWSLEDIPDALLMAIYLNPACALLNILDRVELPNKTKLRDKAKALTAKAFISFREEERAEL
ncbi:hypothetical protein BG011_000209 [Mortierella polycephala]|uniref:Uncharacterized protein n=1 Tax=Mortierella polycephala TaxID=41804 RepID=A0A9P6TVH4_9FUNG|nr:hypothetical protein BG011_000209 [Mortierella polycephala]